MKNRKPREPVGTHPQPLHQGESALSRRIKRHVVGRIQEFFVSTAPGFESLCLDELHEASLATRDGRSVPGGVQFSGRLHECYQANLMLRTANRVLMRIGLFKATGFRELERRLSRFPWELYLPPDAVIEPRVASHHSRLHHSEAIAERLRGAIRRPEGAGSGVVQRLFVRVVDDRFTLSLDSSGDHLHKRGIKTHAAAAPIRETLAAAALRIAGYDGREVVVDPMCGSGTFALEAAMMAGHIPPGWHRSFAFMKWPSFRPGRWAFLRKEAGKRMTPPPRRPAVFASDRDPKACALLQACLDSCGLSDMVRVGGQDFFDLVPSDLGTGKGLVVINPPYGRRLGTPAESRRLFREICRKLASEYNSWKIVLIPPPGFPLRMIPFGLTPHPVPHGGLMVHLLVGRVA